MKRLLVWICTGAWGLSSACMAIAQQPNPNQAAYGIGRLHNRTCAELMHQLGPAYDFDSNLGFAHTVRHLSPASPTLPYAYALIPALYGTVPQADVLTNRQPMYEALQLSVPAVGYLEALFTLPDHLTYPQAKAQIAALQAQAAADPTLEPQARQLVLMTYEVAAGSATLWHNHFERGEGADILIGSHIATDTTKPDSVRRVPFVKLFKADGFGLLKGILSGLVIYVLGNLFKLPEVPFIIGGSVVAVAWPVFDSLWFSSRYRKGLIKEENPEFFY